MSQSSFDYEVIVIGSGFGGSVSALRAAEKGHSVGGGSHHRALTLYLPPKKLNCGNCARHRSERRAVLLRMPASDTSEGYPLSSGLLAASTPIYQSDVSQFDLRTGEILREPATRLLGTYPVREQGGQIQVRI